MAPKQVSCRSYDSNLANRDLKEITTSFLVRYACLSHCRFEEFPAEPQKDGEWKAEPIGGSKCISTIFVKSQAESLKKEISDVMRSRTAGGKEHFEVERDKRA